MYKLGPAALLFVSLSAAAQMHPVEQSSAVKFSIKNFGFAVTGSFAGLAGDIFFDPASPGAARFDVSVDATTINTGNESRDEHLRTDDYFDVKNHPRIRLVSQSVRAGSNGKFLLDANLTIRDKTKSVSFPFQATPAGKGFVFEGSFKINRRDFGVGGSSTVSDNLTVDLKVEAN